MPSEPLANKLKSVDDAIERLASRTAGQIIHEGGRGVADPDVLAALHGLVAVVRELAQHKWTQGEG